MRLMAVTLMCCVVAVAAWGEKLPAPESALPETLISGWTLKDAVKTYDKTNLYEYIDGEAELFFPYGFEKLASAQYQTAAGDGTALVADVFVMGSLLDAFGVYSNFRRSDAELVAIGGEGFVNVSQAMFYQGRYFVVLSVSGATELDKDVFRDAAQAISRKLPGAKGKAKPQELDWLAVDKAVPKTQKYFVDSPFGLSFLPPVVVVDVAGETPAVRVFVGIAKSPDDAAKALDGYTEYAVKNNAQPKSSQMPWGRRVTAQDPMYKGFALEQYGRYILGAIGLPDTDKAIELDHLRARVKP